MPWPVMASTKPRTWRAAAVCSAASLSRLLAVGLHIARTKAHDSAVTGRTVSVRPWRKRRVMDDSSA